MKPQYNCFDDFLDQYSTFLGVIDQSLINNTLKLFDRRGTDLGYGRHLTERIFKTEVCVSQEHIDSASPGLRTNPVALALHDLRFFNSYAYYDYVMFDSFECKYLGVLPRVAENFLTRYLDGFKLAPFKFWLEVRNVSQC